MVFGDPVRFFPLSNFPDQLCPCKQVHVASARCSTSTHSHLNDGRANHYFYGALSVKISIEIQLINDFIVKRILTWMFLMIEIFSVSKLVKFTLKDTLYFKTIYQFDWFKLRPHYLRKQVLKESVMETKSLWHFGLKTFTKIFDAPMWQNYFNVFLSDIFSNDDIIDRTIIWTVK